MTSFQKPVAEIIPGVMALGLVARSSKVADDALKGKGKPDAFLKNAIETLVGVPLIGAVASSVSVL